MKQPIFADTIADPVVEENKVPDVVTNHNLQDDVPIGVDINMNAWWLREIISQRAA